MFVFKRPLAGVLAALITSMLIVVYENLFGFSAIF